MIFFASVFLAIVWSYLWAKKDFGSVYEWFMLFVMLFLGLWSGMHFWGMVLESLAAFIWWAA